LCEQDVASATFLGNFICSIDGTLSLEILGMTASASYKLKIQRSKIQVKSCIYRWAVKNLMGTSKTKIAQQNLSDKKLVNFGNFPVFKPSQ
jgi:hypothetical protein